MKQDNPVIPLASTYQTKVHPDWVDYNDHMRDSFYSLTFSLAVDRFQEETGLGDEYRKRERNTVYALEFHNYFLLEVKMFAELDIQTFVLNSDAKRIHLYQKMQSAGALVAICESMQLHVSQRGTPKAVPFPDTIYRELQSRIVPAEYLAGLMHRSRKLDINNKKREQST
ncbi:MAG: thioesterase family protein [Rhodobacteraceae bacterium]|nr:thioesterase family protein [Paracoccaceae bacterium]